MLDDEARAPAIGAASANHAEMPERDLPMPVMAMPVPWLDRQLLLTVEWRQFWR